MNIDLDTTEAGDSMDIPNSIFSFGLTLREIGAVVVIAGLSDTIELDQYLNSTDLQEAVALLREKGIFSHTVEGNNIKMKLNLDDPKPLSKRQ